MEDCKDFVKESVVPCYSNISGHELDVCKPSPTESVVKSCTHLQESTRSMELHEVNVLTYFLYRNVH